MWRLLVLVVVLALAVVGSAEQCGQMGACPECKDEPKAEDCKSGCLTKDICGCCKVCAKAEDEPCKGIHDYYGYCADGLYCDTPDRLIPGTCKKCDTVPDCTVDVCGGAEKATVCSAKGKMKTTRRTNECQQTTCGSCFHVAESDCTPCVHKNQTKEGAYNRCLKTLHSCLRKHYRTSSTIQNLTAVTNSTTAGFIFCKKSFI